MDGKQLSGGHGAPRKCRTTSLLWGALGTGGVHECPPTSLGDLLVPEIVKILIKIGHDSVTSF